MVYGEGKTTDEVLEMGKRLATSGGAVLLTRLMRGGGIKPAAAVTMTASKGASSGHP